MEVNGGQVIAVKTGSELAALWDTWIASVYISNTVYPALFVIVAEIVPALMRFVNILPGLYRAQPIILYNSLVLYKTDFCTAGDHFCFI